MTRSNDYGTQGNALPTGAHCCRAFTLGWAFLELDTAYQAAMRGEATFTRLDGSTSPVIEDILTIGPMLRLVGVCDRNPLGGEAYPEPRKVWRCVHNRPNYTCAIYDRRPKMCRVYPRNLPSQTCEYLNCQTRACAFWPGATNATDKSGLAKQPEVHGADQDISDHRCAGGVSG